MILIPTDFQDADFKQTVSLDGSSYVIRFEYSDRSVAWYMSLFLQSEGEDLPIVQGVRVGVLWPFLIGVTTDGRPPGDIFALGPRDPGREDLGKAVKLYYFTAEELAG